MGKSDSAHPFHCAPSPELLINPSTAAHFSARECAGIRIRGRRSHLFRCWRHTCSSHALTHALGYLAQLFEFTHLSRRQAALAAALPRVPWQRRGLSRLRPLPRPQKVVTPHHSKTPSHPVRAKACACQAGAISGAWGRNPQASGQGRPGDGLYP